MTINVGMPIVGLAICLCFTGLRFLSLAAAAGVSVDQGFVCCASSFAPVIC